MNWHPSITVHSERSAGRQALRGLAAFSAGAVVIAGLLLATGWAKGVWDRRQEANAARAALASLGLKRICVGEHVDRDCLRRAADTSHTTVLAVPDVPGDLLVSSGLRSAHPQLQAAPLSYNAMSFRYAALQELWVGAPNGLNYDLISGPGARPDAAYKATRRVAVHGLRVDVFVRTLAACGCRDEPGLRKVWATWRHDGQAYAAWFVLGARDGTPAAFLGAVLPRVQYVAPTSRV